MQSHPLTPYYFDDSYFCKNLKKKKKSEVNESVEQNVAACGQKERKT